MKSVLIFFLLLFSVTNVFAQKQFGLSAMPVLMLPSAMVNNVVTKEPMKFGIRGDLLRTKLGIDRFQQAYIGLAFSYFPGSKADTAVLGIASNNTPDVIFRGTRKQSQVEGILKIGFEIPQRWNEFLTLNIGFGAGMGIGKTTYDLPGYDPQNYYLPVFQNQMMTQTNGEVINKGYGTLTGIFLSGFYELDKFYIFSQVDFIMNSSQFTDELFSVRFNAGIYYAFNREKE